MPSRDTNTDTHRAYILSAPHSRYHRILSNTSSSRRTQSRSPHVFTPPWTLYVPSPVRHAVFLLSRNVGSRRRRPYLRISRHIFATAVPVLETPSNRTAKAVTYASLTTATNSTASHARVVVLVSGRNDASNHDLYPPSPSSFSIRRSVACTSLPDRSCLCTPALHPHEN